MIPDRRTRAEVFPTDGYPVAAARVRVEQDVPAHTHDFCELAVVLGGQLEHGTRHGRRHLAAGDVVAVRPGAWHEYRRVVDAEVINIYVGPELFTVDLEWAWGYRALTELLLGSGDALVRLGVQGLGRVVGWLDQVAGLPRGRGLLAAVQLRGLLGATLAEVAAGRHDPTGGQELVSPAVRVALGAMSADPSRAWTVADLARTASVSPSHLHHQFREQLGTSPLRWLTRHRAEQMALRLVGSDQTVARIGAAVGWPDPNYAARRFRAEFALAPTSYRERFTLPPRP